VSGQLACLTDQGLNAAALDKAPLVQSQGTKRAGSKAAAVADDGKLNRQQGGHPTPRFIAGVFPAGKIHFVYFIQLAA
jgi:hypothetical protein